MNSSSARSLSPIESAIIRTVCYSAVFRFPLTPEELAQGLIREQVDDLDTVEVYRQSDLLQRVIDFERGYFVPRGRSSWIDDRIRRRKITADALHRHRLALRLICALPFTRLVALSGSCAFENMDEGEDIDLFLVTRKGCLWTTALMILLLARLLRCRRAICFNFMVSERAMELERCDLFAANQAAWLVPLTGSELYRDFLAANPSIRRYYPNRTVEGCDLLPSGPAGRVSKRAAETLLLLGPHRILEPFSRALYRRYLLARSGGWESPEEVRLEPERLKLHTRSHRARVLAQFNASVRQMLMDAGAGRPVRSSAGRRRSA